MAEAVQPTVPITTPSGRSPEDYKNSVSAVAVFPNGRRMVTAISSYDQTLRLWDLETGVVLKELKGHGSSILAVAVSRDGKLITSGDFNGEFIAWHEDTGEPLIHGTNVHTDRIRSLDFSPDGAVLATGSKDNTVKLWRTETWQVHKKPINCGGGVYCVRYSPSGELLAIATHRHIEVRDPNNLEHIAKFNTSLNFSLAWTPDGTRLLSGSSILGLTIREWDTSTWKQVGDNWSGITGAVHVIAVNFKGTLVASASHNHHDVRLWRLSDRRTIAIFTHSKPVSCVVFSIDDKHIFSSGLDNKISKWAVPEDIRSQDPPIEQVPEETFPQNASERQVTNNLKINSMIPDANIIGCLPTAEELSLHERDTNGNDHKSYAKRSILKAQRCDWDEALNDAHKSINIKPSLTGYLSQGIALCGNKRFQDATKAFDLAFMFTDGNIHTTLLLLLVKAIASFNANQCREAMLRIQELAAACPNIDVLACRVVEAYLCFQLGTTALDGDCHDEAVDHFTAAIDNVVFSSEHPIHMKYEVFVVLFGWDLKSLWHNVHQKRCYALLQAGRQAEAHDAHQYIINMSDNMGTACCREWSIAFQEECRALHIRNGDVALSAEDYDKAIELYSSAIDLDSTVDAVFAKRCTAKLKTCLPGIVTQH